MTTVCSEAQMVPLSKVLEMIMSTTAAFRSADFSKYTGVFPAPTPRAGLPELYAAFTTPGPPVASIKPTALCRIKKALSARVGDSTQVNTPSGAPCFTAVSYMIRMASEQHRHAFGWGLKTTAFLVLMATMHLNSTVDVGLVIGVSENSTPIGSAISIRFRSGYSRITPTVRLSLMWL